MPVMRNTSEPHTGTPPKDSANANLMQRLKMVQEINGCSRLLLHNTTGNDAAQATLAHLQRVTGVCRIGVFAKQIVAENEIVFDWRYSNPIPESGTDHRRGDRNAMLCHPQHVTPTRLAEGQPVWLSPQTGGAENSDRQTASTALILPIAVCGDWWGGLFLSGGDSGLFNDDTIIQALVTAADLLGIYFEREIATSENAARDKLAGALEMAGTVCHKLNQPMQVILGYASMVTSGDINEPEQVCAIVKMIEDETRRMGIITKNLMGITKYHTVETPNGGAMCDIDGEALPA